MQVVDRFIDCLFVLDLVFNFRTTYVNKKTDLEVSEPKKIAINYIFFGRFFIDLLAVIPFDLFIPTDQDNSGSTASKKQFKFFGLLKLIRLLRLGRIITYMKLRQSFKVGFRMLMIMLFLFIVVHWVGCLWYLIVNDDTKAWIPPNERIGPEFYSMDL